MQPAIMKRFKVLFIPLLGISISESSRDFAKGEQDCTAGEQINDPKHTNTHTHLQKAETHLLLCHFHCVCDLWREVGMKFRIE